MENLIWMDLNKSDSYDSYKLKWLVTFYTYKIKIKVDNKIH